MEENNNNEYIVERISDLEKSVNSLNTSMKEIIFLLEEISKKTLGNSKECPFCGSTFPVFKPFGIKGRPNARCPVCNSLERHRSLFLYLKNKTKVLSDDTSKTLLHFAPEKPFRMLFDSMKNLDYWPVDINPETEGVKKQIDIQKIDFESGVFDYIICNHVLEHIPDDSSALKELFRVLKQGGVAIISVPMNVGQEKTYENPLANTDELRYKYFGQKDHVRIYGMDIKERMMKVGFRVDIVTPNESMSSADLEKYGLLKNVIFFFCTK